MHIVVTGKIRHLATYRHLLQRIVQAQKAGVVQSATLVHWRSDEGAARDLMASARCQAELKLLDEPQQRSIGHYLHQALSFQEGMASLRPDDVVLRLRPDVFGLPGFLEGVSKVLDASTKPFWSAHADLTCPYFANDILFGGRVEALRAQTNFSLEPYLNPLHRSPRETNYSLSHEPEVQRWLHPWRDEDGFTRAYWRTFPNFGFASGRRTALVRRYHDWDFYEMARLGWLRRLVRDVALGAGEDCPVFGFVRAGSPTAVEGELIPWTRMTERERFDTDEVLEAEASEYVWTSSDRKAAEFLAFCEARAAVQRDLSPDQARAELAEIWQDALTEPEHPLLHVPMQGITVTF